MGFIKKFFRKSKSISDIDSEKRIDILDLYNKGLKPSEISEETGIDVKRIYRIAEMENKKNNSDVDDIRRLELDLKKIELQIKIDEMEHRRKLNAIELEQDLLDIQEPESNEQASSPMETILMGFLQGLIRPNQNIQGSNIQTTTHPNEQQGSVTSEQIKDILNQYPKHIQKLQKLPDDIIIQKVKEFIPNRTDLDYQLTLSEIKKFEVK